MISEFSYSGLLAETVSHMFAQRAEGKLGMQGALPVILGIFVDAEI